MAIYTDFESRFVVTDEFGVGDLNRLLDRIVTHLGSLHGLDDTDTAEAWRRFAREDPEAWKLFYRSHHENNHLRIYYLSSWGWILQHCRAVQMAAFMESLIAGSYVSLDEQACTRYLKSKLWTTERFRETSQRFRRSLALASKGRDLIATAEHLHNLLYGARSKYFGGPYDCYIENLWPEPPKKVPGELWRLARMGLAVHEQETKTRKWVPRSLLEAEGLTTEIWPEELLRYFRVNDFCPVWESDGLDYRISGDVVAECLAFLQELRLFWALGIPADLIPRKRSANYTVLLDLYRSLNPDIPTLEEIVVSRDGPTQDISAFDHHFGWLIIALALALWIPYHPRVAFKNQNSFQWFDLHPGWRCVVMLSRLSRDRKVSESPPQLTARSISNVQTRLAQDFGWPSHGAISWAWSQRGITESVPTKLVHQRDAGEGWLDQTIHKSSFEVGTAGIEALLGIGDGKVFEQIHGWCCSDGIGVMEKEGEATPPHAKGCFCESSFLKAVVLKRELRSDVRLACAKHTYEDLVRTMTSRIDPDTVRSMGSIFRNST